MTVVYDREEFRKYLQDSGLVLALSRAFLKLYELKEKRPKSAIKFIEDHIGDKTPSLLEFETLKDDLKDLAVLIADLKKAGKLDVAQLAVVNKICMKSSLLTIPDKSKTKSGIVVRQSQTALGNDPRTSTQNMCSRIRKKNPTDTDYDTEIKKAIDELKRKNPKSLLGKHIDGAIYDANKGVTDGSGEKNLVNCICSGLDIPESIVGVYAVADDSYDKYQCIFKPIINDYHGTPTGQHPTTDWGDATTLKDIDSTKKFILSTRIRCIRNVQSHPLVPKMDKAKLDDLHNKIREVFKNKIINVAGLEGVWHQISALAPEKKKELSDKGYILEFGDKFLESAGCTEHWPDGRAVYISKTETFFVWINEEDHLRFISIEEGSNLREIYGRLAKAVKLSDADLTPITSLEYGYITLCPTNLGNTIRASVMIKLPKLCKDRTELDPLLQSHCFEMSGDVSKGTIEISNKKKIGITEFESVKKFQDGIEAIIAREEAL